MGSLRWGTWLATTTTTVTTNLDMMMKLVILAALVSLAAAQGGGAMGMAASFMDKNKDGVIEQSEAATVSIEGQVWDMFNCMADANGDGKLQVKEFGGVYSKMTDTAFMQEAAQKCAGCSVSINMILFSLASLMAMIWK